MRDLGAVLLPLGFHGAGGCGLAGQLKAVLTPELLELWPQLFGALVHHQPALVAGALHAHGFGVNRTDRATGGSHDRAALLR